jgi:hypothetical protein
VQMRNNTGSLPDRKGTIRFVLHRPGFFQKT